MQKIVNAMWKPVMDAPDLLMDLLAPVLLIVGGAVTIVLAVPR